MVEQTRIPKVQRPKKAYLFDVDGVLTNPEAKRVEQEELFGELIKRLRRGEPVGFNTGRSLKFMIEHVLKPLEARVGDDYLLHDLFAIGEKGAAWITYDENGVQNATVDKSISIPQEIQDEVRNLVSKPPYNEIMFFDVTKQTMVSVELLPDKTIEQFQEPQRQLNAALRDLLTRHGLQDQYKIDPTRIATDVENIDVGKHLGARRFVELLHERGIEPEEYVGFGDSTSDYDMYEELQKLGKRAHFVFVGGREHLAGKPEDGVIFTNESVDKGTLEYLQNEQD